MAAVNARCDELVKHMDVQCNNMAETVSSAVVQAALSNAQIPTPGTSEPPQPQAASASGDKQDAPCGAQEERIVFADKQWLAEYSSHLIKQLQKCNCDICKKFCHELVELVDVAASGVAESRGIKWTRPSKHDEASEAQNAEENEESDSVVKKKQSFL